MELIIAIPWGQTLEHLHSTNDQRDLVVVTEKPSESDLQSVLLEATRLSEEGQDSDALELLLESEGEHSDDPMLLCMIGALAGHLGAEGMAVDFFNRCLQQQPTDAQVLITAGAGLAAAGDPGAEPALRLAAVTNPELAPARMHYGALLIRSGILEQGVEELLEARRLDPSDADIRRELGIAYLLSARSDEALDELESASAAGPEDWEARLLWSLAMINAKEIDRAAEELHPLGELLADDGNTQLLLALVFATQEWEDEAWLALSRAEAAEPPVDPAALREVEEALEAGSDAAQLLLLEEVAPSALRERIYLT